MNWIRKHLSAWFLTTGTWLAPRYAHAGAVAIMRAVQKLPEEIAKGRTGGLLIVRWRIDSQGAVLSADMERAALRAAHEVRHRWELIERELPEPKS